MKILIAILMVACAPLWAGESCLYKIKPDAYIEGKIIEAVEGRGLLQLHGTTVLGPVCAKGGFEAFCADLNCVGVCGRAYLDNSHVHQDISVCGKAVFRKTTVEGITDIRGTFEAHDSDFRNCIQIASTMIELTNTNAAGIYIFPYGDCCNDIQIVRLSHGSFIQGDIIFESGRGRILMDQCSAIDGNVYGGFITYPGDCGCH